MAPPPHAGLTDYERLREENVRRSDAILASLRCEAAELSASFRAPSPKRPRRQPPQPRSTSPVVVRRSLRNRGLPPSASSSLSTPPSPPKPGTTRISSSLAGSLRAAAAAGDASAPATEDGFDAGRELVLRPADVRRVVPDRILSVRILPLAHRTVVAAGNKIGHIGLWDVDGVVEDGDGAEGVFQYFPHRGPVGAIVVHPALPGKIYSCSYRGEICLMDVEKETFDTIQLCDYPILSLCQAPNNPHCLYFGEGNGELKLFDERMGKMPNTWNAHDTRINSIDFHPENPNMFATSSTDHTVCLWDLRRLKNKAPENLKVFEHSKSVHSAYFSPSGGMIATTSLDDTVRIFYVDEFNVSHILRHDNQTGAWLSTFKAIWSWNDTYLFIGNMKRVIDVISIDCTETNLSASFRACLESEYMTAIPCRFSLHPYKIGHLACASSGGGVSLVESLKQQDVKWLTQLHKQRIWAFWMLLLCCAPAGRWNQEDRQPKVVAPKCLFTVVLVVVQACVVDLCFCLK